ncbi:sensor histidine kinase [Actinoplanes sp. NPDC089786]|uniref:sensor histidine kinase n=1 Tax=Actinoplanes sp. NPDC089786 TaxID=3155185 RepID=UPI00343030DE
MRGLREYRPSWLRWRFVAVPVVIWLVLTTIGAAGLLHAQHNSRERQVQLFELRVALMGDFVTSYVTDLIERERAVALAVLTGPAVSRHDFNRMVSGFGYPAAVLLDESGRVLHVAPDNPAIDGTDLTDRYAHLRTAVKQRRPAVSTVVPSAARGTPVVAFAVPFDTASGPRVFSGAIDIRHNQLSSYVSTALSLSGVRIQLVDSSGAIVAANRPLYDAIPNFTGDDPTLAAALRHQPTGRYEQDGNTWRYASEAIPGTPWRLSATVREDVLGAASADSQLAGSLALTAAAVVGLIVVAAVARSRRNRRDLQRNEAELAQRAEQLQQANAQMSDFLAMLTHDVRQPLANVVATGELVLADWEEIDQDTKHHYLRRMIHAGHRASDLVGEILTLAQLDAGALVARPVRLDIAHAAREAAGAHNTTLEQPIIVVAPDQCTALADPALLQLILGNLLGNATKYGAPPVTVTVVNDPDHVRIHVADHGEGIPEAFLPHLFDRFSRAGTGIATTKPGTGLGLYFVRQLANASGLTIDYRPNHPHGAVFDLTLPHAPPQRTAAGRDGLANGVPGIFG